MRNERKKPTASELEHDPISGPNVIFSEWRGTMDDTGFHAGLAVWTHLARQTAKRLEQQIGRPHTEFNRDCLTQELLWHVCHALRRSRVKNRPGFVITVVRNRARDILRRARARSQRLNTESLSEFSDQCLTDHRRSAQRNAPGVTEILEQVSLTLPEIQQRALATACLGETRAAISLGISRRQLRKIRTAVRGEFERRGLREFLSTSTCRGNGVESKTSQLASHGGSQP